MSDPKLRALLAKAEEMKVMSERLIEQSRKLKEQADQLIADSKQLTSKDRRKLP
jgi:hypothetical protein